jgi:GNAT superfamily N-acetyltransferase
VSEPSITRVGSEDLTDLLPLIREYCEIYESSPSDDDLLALSSALISDPEREGLQLIARAEDAGAVGFATVFWTWSTTDAHRLGVMNDLYVVEQARGGGLAERLIEACRSECARRGAFRLAWQTAPENLRAQAVYERVGGTREQWVDYWISVRELSRGTL